MDQGVPEVAVKPRVHLHRQVQLAAFGLAMIVAAAIGVVNLALALRDLPRAAQASNDTAAHLIASYLGTILAKEVDELRNLAATSLIWTALSDSQGRDIYIKPFLDDRNQAMAHGRIALLDYKGRFVAGKAQLIVGEEVAVEELAKQVLTAGEAGSRLVEDSKAILLVGVPIVYAYTEDVIGVMLGAYDLAGLLGRQTVADLVGRGVQLRMNDQTWTLWSGNGEQTGVFVPGFYPIAHPELTSLYELGIEVYSTRNPWRPVLKERAAFTLLVALGLAGVVWWLAGLAARRVSERLERLANRIQAHPTCGPEDIPEDHTGDEVAVLSGALRQALQAHERARGELRQLAYYDPLTGLMNRMLFEERLTEAIQRHHRHGDRYALLFIDLDRFKVVNDTAGHEAGDILLREIAERIRHRVRSTDLASRRSGDEFTLLMMPCEQDQDAILLAEDLIYSLSLPCHLETGISVAVGASIGIAFFPGDGATADELQTNADAAMYAAKERGGGRYCLYGGGEGRSIHDRLLMESALRQALIEDQLELMYQPQIDLGTGRIMAVEALCRWRDPHFGEVPPAVFIPLAETTGLISRLSGWLLRRACSQMMSCPHSADLLLSVNISPGLLSGDFLNLVKEVLRETGWPPPRLELEMTEASLLRAPAEAESTLLALRRLGIRLAMDDFGSGYSPLGYLQRLAVGKIKLDPLLIQELHAEAEDDSLLSTLIDMAHRLNLQVVAEGVETSYQRDILRRYGCDQAQGFLYGPPVEAQAWGDFCAADLAHGRDEGSCLTPGAAHPSLQTE